MSSGWLNKEAITKEAMKRCVLEDENLRKCFAMGVQVGIEASDAFVSQLIEAVKRRQEKV